MRGMLAETPGWATGATKTTCLQAARTAASSVPWHATPSSACAEASASCPAAVQASASPLICGSCARQSAACRQHCREAWCRYLIRRTKFRQLFWWHVHMHPAKPRFDNVFDVMRFSSGRCRRGVPAAGLPAAPPRPPAHERRQISAPCRGAAAPQAARTALLTPSAAPAPMRPASFLSQRQAGVSGSCKHMCLPGTDVCWHFMQRSKGAEQGPPSS